MSLRDLKNLAPWQWESKIAQKKHAIGPKGLQDFEQIARVLQNDSSVPGTTDVKEKQAGTVKRRRSGKEADEAPAAAKGSGPSADATDAALAAATPSISLKKHRGPSGTTDHRSSSSNSASQQQQQKDSNRRSPSADFNTLHPVALTPAPPTCKGHSAAAAAAAAAAAEQPGADSCCQPLLQLQPALKVPAPTPTSAVRTPAAQKAAGLLADAFSPSPVPTPTPYATLRFKGASEDSSAARGLSSGSAAKPPGTCCLSATKPRPGFSQRGGNSSMGRTSAVSAAAAAAGTPLPRPQFTPLMPPPANRRSSTGGLCLQQTPISSTAAVAGGSSSSSSLKRASTAAADMPLPRLQQLLSGGGSHSPDGGSNGFEMQNPNSSTALQNPRAPQGGAAEAGSFSMMSPKEATGGLVFKAGSWQARDTHSPPAAALATLVGMAAVTPDTAAAAAAATSSAVLGGAVAAGDNRASEQGVAATARLPAKLRCKKEGSRSVTCQVIPSAGLTHVGANTTNISHCTPSPAFPQGAAAAAAAEGAGAGDYHDAEQSPVAVMGGLLSLADLAEAAAAEAAEGEAAAAAAAAAAQQEDVCEPDVAGGWAGFGGSSRRNSDAAAEQQTPVVAGGGSSSSCKFVISTCEVEAAAASAGSSEDRSRAAVTVTPAGRMGLKRLWCNTHAAAMAAEAAAAAAAAGSAALAKPGSSNYTPEAGPDSTKVSPEQPGRSRSPDSLAVAMSAELLLAAAELDVSPPASAEKGSPAAAAATVAADDQAVGMEVDTIAGCTGSTAVPFDVPAAALDGVQHSVLAIGGAVEKQPLLQEGMSDVQTCSSAAAAATAVDAPAQCFVSAGAPSKHCQQQQQQQQQQRKQHITEHGSHIAAAAAAATAATAAETNCPGGSSCGNSLMLPPAAQKRLMQQQQQQQQIRGAQQPTSTSASSSNAATASAQSTWALIPSSTGAVMTPFGQLGPTAAAGAAGVPCLAVSMPLALQPMSLQQLAAAAGYNSYNSYPGCYNSNAAAAMGGGSSSSSGSGNSTRMPHVPPAVHAAQCNMTRTSHTGVLLQASHPALQALQNPNIQAAAWNTQMLLLQQQQQQQQAAAVDLAWRTSSSRGHQRSRSTTPEPPAARPSSSSGSRQQQQQHRFAHGKPCLNLASPENMQTLANARPAKHGAAGASIEQASKVAAAAAASAAAASSSNSSMVTVNKPPAHPIHVSGSTGNSSSAGLATARTAAAICAPPAAAVGSSSSSKAGSDQLGLPAIQPLQVPGTLSDDEAWRLALSQPWLIESEAARAHQLLSRLSNMVARSAGAGTAAAPRTAAAAVGAGSSDSAAASAGLGRTVGSAGALAAATVDSERTAAATAAAAAAATYSCAGVRSGVQGLAGQQQQQMLKAVQQQQQGGGRGGGFGALRAIDGNVTSMQQ